MLEQTFSYLRTAQASSHPFPNSVRPHLVASTSLCSPCVTYMDPVLCHWSPSASHPCLGKKNFPRGGKYLNHVHPLSQLIFFPSKGITQQVLLMCQGLLRSIINHSMVSDSLYSNTSIIWQMQVLSARPQNLLVFCVLELYLYDNQYYIN